MKALITGVEGFTGRYLATELHNTGYDVVGLIHKPQSATISGTSVVHVADICNGAALKIVIEKIQPDFVAHLAAISFAAHGDVEAIYRTNLIGTRNLLEALLSTGKPLTSVLLASSANIYGNSSCGMLDETTPPAPTNDYAVSKLAMEYMAHSYGDRLPIVIARPFNYTGKGQSEDFLLPKIVSHVLRRSNIIELGNLDVARDFSDVRTIVKYYRRLLECQGTTGRTFNVCSGRAYTLQDILDMIKAISGHEFKIRLNPAFVRSNEIKSLLGNRERLVKMVGEVPEIQLQETLRWMLNEAS